MVKWFCAHLYCKLFLGTNVLKKYSFLFYDYEL